MPILIVYLLANISLPLYMLAANRAAFRPVKHALIPLIGSAVLVYGVYAFVQPSQPPLANVFWAWILGIVLVAEVATAIVYMRRPGALQKGGHVRAGIHRAGSPGPLGGGPPDGGCGVTEDAEESGEAIRGPIDASQIPRYAGPPTFALLPRRDPGGGRRGAAARSRGRRGVATRVRRPQRGAW